MSKIRISDKITSLFEVKKIIAIMMATVFCYLSIIQKIDSKDFITVFTIIISFYFSQSSIRQAIQENGSKKEKQENDDNGENITSEGKI